MIGKLWVPRRLLIGGLILLGLDLGLWVGPHLGLLAHVDSLLFLLALGVAALATGAGLGGAVLMVPVLLFLRHLGIIDWPPTEISTLAAMAAALAAGNGARIQRKKGLVLGGLAWKMGIVGATTAVVMAIWSSRWTPSPIVSLDAFMALTAVLCLWAAPHPREGRSVTAAIPERRILAATMLVAASSGVTGMPGSYLLIPLLLWVSPLPYRQVAATTLQAIFIIALATFLMKVHQGFLSPSHALPLGLGSLIGSMAGARWAQRSSPRTLRLLATLTILLGSATSLFF
ncbi:sulfite exporter TauE/SafE family protein [Sulfobacillus harzensis]|uniref:Probable membrane transporter protein n=1 Tax=Sulfobacillus harzensis TaxID=2729629 RepID=A0A7Y0L1T6_9FIRM|nr:sulfite exporter TauE/SafE family protein [Sulfobacillus harzensis]NMP21508.1 sulfite exporter TauE/SafE family protein [Sulfobacillus harzensis]